MSERAKPNPEENPDGPYLTLDTEDLAAADAMDAAADFVPTPELQKAEEPPTQKEIDGFQRDSLLAQQVFDGARELAAHQRYEEAIVEFTRAAKIAEVAHEWHLAAVASRQVGDFYADEIPPYDLQRSFRMYRRAVAAYEACGLFAEARDLAYHQILLKMRRGSELNLSLWYRAMLWLEWAVAGFGYRPERVIVTNFVLILLFGTVYALIGGIYSSQGAPIVGSFLSRWSDSVYFSATTYLTVGYGDFLPKPHVRLIAMTESFVGFFMMGLFVAVLANRMSKH